MGTIWGWDDMASKAVEDRARQIAEAHSGREGPLLPILHEVQEQFGHVPSAAIPVIADVLNLGKAEVYGVVTFYHDFRDKPAGRRVLKLCRAEACQAVGGNVTADRIKELLGLDWHETTPDGAVTLEPVYCLGLCACGPAALLDDKVVGRVTGERAEALVTEART